MISDSTKYNIQIFRGICIAAVVFIHNTPSGIAQLWCRPFFNFAVGLFLFLSGMLSSIDTWNPIKRIRKVLIPYVIWTFIYTVLNGARFPKQIAVEFFLSLLLGNSAPMMYYCFIYCELTILLPLVDILAKSKYRLLGFCVTPTEIILLRLVPLVFGMNVNSSFQTILNLSCVGWFMYYYLGYLLGNKLIEIKLSTRTILILLLASIPIQVLEGYWYYIIGDINCGTQLKLSAILTGSLFSILAYKLIYSKRISASFLKILGDHSFGVYFSHIAVMKCLEFIPRYSELCVFPLNAGVTVIVSLILVQFLRKLFGKYAMLFAF